MACGVVSMKSHCTIPDVRLNDTSVFSKCAESMENGRRLENLSWRIWNRETLCCETTPHMSTTPAIDIARPRPGRKEVPELSASVDSVSSEESDADEDTQASLEASTAPLDIQSSLRRSPPTTVAASRSKEKHITSLGLEKLVCSIKDKQEIGPLSPSISDAIPAVLPSTTDITPRPTSPTMNAPYRSSDSSSSTAPMSSPDSDQSTTQTVGSDTSAELATSHSVVRGFSPNHVSSSYRSHTHLAPAPIPTKSMMPSKGDEPKKGGMFMLGGSSGEDDSSFEDRMTSQQKQSSLTAGLKRPHGAKKTLSFRDEVESRQLNNKSHEDEGVFESSDEEEDIPDSAIDSEEEEEDDDEDWEDEASDANDNAVQTPLFQRVNSKPNLVSRRSLLTTLMNEGDRAAAFQNMASRSTPALRRSRSSKGSPPIGLPAEDPSKDSNVDTSMPVLGPHMTRSKPIIVTTSNSQHQMALSPRTTRRNMLSTEMTESLRKHVLWERQQKKATANAVLRRRHTAHNLVNLQDYPGRDHGESSRNYGPTVGEYHQVGW